VVVSAGSKWCCRCGVSGGRSARCRPLFLSFEELRDPILPAIRCSLHPRLSGLFDVFSPVFVFFARPSRRYVTDVFQTGSSNVALCFGSPFAPFFACVNCSGVSFPCVGCFVEGLRHTMPRFFIFYPSVLLVGPLFPAGFISLVHHVACPSMGGLCCTRCGVCLVV